MLSNGWVLLFGLVLLNNKSQENVQPLRSEESTPPSDRGPDHLVFDLMQFCLQAFQIYSTEMMILLNAVSNLLCEGETITSPTCLDLPSSC